MGLGFFKGTVHTTEKMFFAGNENVLDIDKVSFTYEEAITACGAFFAIFSRNNGEAFSVLNDFHGFKHLFWSSAVSGKLLVSDNIVALSQSLSELGVSPEICSEIAYAQFASFNALLNQRNFSTQTLHKHISLLRPDQELYISETGVTLRQRPTLVDPEDRDYDTLIHAGVERGAKMMRSARKLDIADEVLYLSGGRDSRNVLALAIAADVHREIPVLAKQPPELHSGLNEKLSIDRALAGMLIEEFNLSLWENRFARRLPEPSKALESWVSHSIGINADLNSTVEVFTEPSMSFIGAMGENYRTKVPDYVDRLNLDLKFTPESKESDFDAFFEKICLKFPQSEPGVYEKTKELFYDSIFCVNSPTLWEGLDVFSELFRMPGHFSTVAYDWTRNSWPVNNLGIPEFAYAASLLSREERADGKVWKDINSNVDPRLNSIPFEFSVNANFAASLPSNIDWASLDARHKEYEQKNSGYSFEELRSLSTLNLQPRILSHMRQHAEILAGIVGIPRLKHLESRVLQWNIHIRRFAGIMELLHQLVLNDPPFATQKVAIGTV